MLDNQNDKKSTMVFGIFPIKKLPGQGQPLNLTISPTANLSEPLI